jgi:hypothetical protein
MQLYLGIMLHFTLCGRSVEFTRPLQAVNTVYADVRMLLHICGSITRPLHVIKSELDDCSSHTWSCDVIASLSAATTGALDRGTAGNRYSAGNGYDCEHFAVEPDWCNYNRCHK